MPDIRSLNKLADVMRDLTLAALVLRQNGSNMVAALCEKLQRIMATTIVEDAANIGTAAYAAAEAIIENDEPVASDQSPVIHPNYRSLLKQYMVAIMNDDPIVGMRRTMLDRREDWAALSEIVSEIRAEDPELTEWMPEADWDERHAYQQSIARSRR